MTAGVTPGHEAGRATAHGVLAAAHPGPAAAVTVLAAVVVTGTGRRPFSAAVAIALVDATLLVVAR